MKKFVCSVCGYVYEGEAAPEFCPLCKAPASCLLYTSPSPRDRTRSRMPSSA